MLKKDLLSDIDIVLSYFKDSPSQMDKTIYKKYFILKNNLQYNILTYNPINGSVRAYLDAFNDWDNSILGIMGDLESKVDLIIKGE